MEQIVENLLNWISANPHWAGLAVFAIAFFESLAIVGLAVPGWLLLVGVGTLIGNGHLNFWLISFASFAGAALGQIVSFAVGHYFNEKVHHWSWVQRHQSMLDRAEGFFKKHGFAGILIGQFIGPIRAVISLVAGILSMPVKKFIVAVLIATAIWAPIYMMPGVLVGTALTFEREQMWGLLACVAIIVVSVWLMSQYILDRIKQVEITRYRHWIFIASLVLFIGVIIFLVNTEYGSLMLNLVSKIWSVIS